MKSILITGLSGSGKTTFSKSLITELQKKYIVDYFNADEIRTKYDDWDFSQAGRQRQLERMIHFKNTSNNDIVIFDFICPKESFRKLLSADTVVWMDTIKNSRYEDTDQIFESPTFYSYRVTDWSQSAKIISEIASLV